MRRQAADGSRGLDATGTGPVRLVIVAPRLAQESLGVLLAQRAGLEIAATCATAEAVATVRHAIPDIVLLELPPRDEGELAAIRAMSRLDPMPRVVAMAAYCSRERILAAIRAGAEACVAPEDGVADVVKAVRALRERRRYMGPIITELIMRSGGLSATAAPGGDEELTPRERQVIALIAVGKTDREIAKDLDVSPKTIHTHRTSIMSKLRVRNVVGLVRRALELGLVS